MGQLGWIVGWARALATVGLIAAMLAGCGGGASRAEVRGSLLQVESSSLTRIDRIRLRDAAGTEWVFLVAPDVAGVPGEPPPSPGHLRQHMAAGDEISVTYRETPEGLIATTIADVRQ